MRLQMGIDPEQFLSAYWQKRPLLMRQALTPDRFSVTPDELAGLACEPEVESRIVIQDGPTAWRVEHGPFAETDFATLPDADWTLLVQDVDKFRPDVADLLDPFDFLPAWRIDDIMISFAADQGSVGPHRDAYDVFLMQGLGRRRWRLGSDRPAADELIPDLDLRILARFDTAQDWILEPGDVLYLPPGVAHWGTAVGDCMTYSLGFRATSQRELVGDWYQHLASLADDAPLGDGAPTPGSGQRLDAALLAQARALVTALHGDNADEFARWLGTHLTEPKPQFHVDGAPQQWDLQALDAFLRQGGTLVRDPRLRLAWAVIGNQLQLFGNGECRACGQAGARTVETLCRNRRLSIDQLAAADLEPTLPLLLELINAGWFEAAS